MKYIETQLTLSFAFHSMRIKYEPSEGAMMIDVSTIQALELIQNAQNSRSPNSLFGLLDKTLTKMGARLLRSSILQPLIDQEVIEKRHDALEELTTHADIFVAVRRGRWARLLALSYLMRHSPEGIPGRGPHPDKRMPSSLLSSLLTT